MVYWLILDELNLAPSDVLEALKIVSLMITGNSSSRKTQEVVRPHEDFMLFCHTETLRGSFTEGGKPLSRALRNRFSRASL